MMECLNMSCILIAIIDINFCRNNSEPGLIRAAFCCLMSVHPARSWSYSKLTVTLDANTNTKL